MARILVVDDETLLRDTVEAILSAEGHTVIQAADGVQALESMKKHMPDVVVCDIEMPKLKGFDVLNELRGTPFLSEIPIIFLTGKTDISYLVKSLELNVNDFLTKPFTAEELISAINIQLKRIQEES